MKTRAECCTDEDGRCQGDTVFLPSEEHPTILGQDGNPLRYARRAAVGFDLRPTNKKGNKHEQQH